MGDRVLTEALIREIIRETIGNFDPDLLGAETPFYDAGLDSLDQVKILLEIEERYGLQVAEGDFDRCGSIQAILAYFGDRSSAS